MEFYFYDLETSGVSPKQDRVMQFAGQRTNKNLEPIGKVDNLLIKLAGDVLPDPIAILTHGISPQQSVSQGLSEADFLGWFNQQVATPKTIIVGYNNIRFDDEFMRYMHYRNFYDPYTWQWQDERSRWDLLDTGRLVRALRPEGIQWPYASNGQASAKLESITAVNKIEHSNAHTADADVLATIEFAKLIKNNQPKMFEYLLKMRSKQEVSRLVNSGQPFVYASGRFSSDFLKTTVAVCLGPHPEQPGSFLVYDLRFDPDELKDLSPHELRERIYVGPKSDLKPLPAKALAANKCPAVAPLGVLDEAAQDRIKLDIKTVQTNLAKLEASDLNLRISQAFADQKQAAQEMFLAEGDEVDTRMYDGFFNPADQKQMAKIRQATADTIINLDPEFNDDRLNLLLPLYKARNFYSQLEPDQLSSWQKHVERKFNSGKPSLLEKFSKNFSAASSRSNLSSQDQFLLQELQLYVQSLL